MLLSKLKLRKLSSAVRAVHSSNYSIQINYLELRVSKKVRYLNGYRLIYLPDHPSAMTSLNWTGYVYEHIAVAESFLGRRLAKDEVVHHLDLNRSNNRTENLLVLLRSQHVKLHTWIDKGAPIEETCRVNGVNSVESKADKIKYCFCGATLQAKEKFFVQRLVKLLL
jgi:hypothetical protein